MIDRTHAGTLAQATLNKGDGITLGEVRELREGWFFPYRAEQLMSGSQGVIVNKRTGRIFNLGSAFPVERDLVLYDRGYQSSLYDLVILAVHDLSATAAGNGAPWLGLVCCCCWAHSALVQPIGLGVGRSFEAFTSTTPRLP